MRFFRFFCFCAFVLIAHVFYIFLFIIALPTTGGEFAHWTFHVENSPNPDAFPSFCVRELKTSSRKKTTKKKKNEEEEEDEVLTFLSGGAEEGENGGAGDDHPSTSGSKTVVRTYDSALKKWTILEPAADKKINAVPDERFGASSTFISDQKVVQFGGVKKRIPPLKPKRICGPHLIKESDLSMEHEAAMKKQNAAYTNETYIFDFKSNTWNHVRVPVRKCPPARAFASLISVTDDVAFLFGGVDAAGRCFNDVWKFDFKNKNEPWKEILAEKEAHEMIPPRMLHAVCALPDGDGMLVVGGRGSKNECLGDAWIFSCEFSVWQKLPEYMSPNMGVFGARLVPARSAVFRIGGAFADEVEGNQVMIEESNVTGTNTAASSQKKKKKSKVSAVELSTTNSGASFFAGAGLTHGNELTNPGYELTNPELFDDDDKKENLWDDVFPLKDCWDADAAALTTDLKTRKKKKSAGGDMKLPSVSITPTKTKKDLSISTKKSTEVQPSLEQSSGRENANNVTSIATTETPRAGVRSAFEPVKGSQAFKVDGRSAPPPAAPVANCEFCVVEFKGKTRNQMLMKHREECSKNPKNIIGEATEKIALSFSKADRLLGLPKLKVQKSAAPKSHGGDLPSLSPRASREEVLVPGVRPAPSDDEDEDKVNAVKKKKMKKQPSKLGRSSSSQMKVASAGSGEVGGKSSGGDAPNNNAAAAAAGAKKNEEKEKATTTTPANNEKSMPPKKRKLAEDGATQKNETTEAEREALRNEECYQRVMQRSVNLPRLHNASGALTVSEADLMKSFAQLANMKEDAFKIMDNKMKAEEKEIWDGAAKHLANAMQSKDYDKLFKELSTNGTTTTTSPYKKAKGGGKLPAIGSKVDSSKSKITGTFDAGYFVELVIDGKKCSGIAFSPVLKTTTIGGKQ